MGGLWGQPEERSRGPPALPPSVHRRSRVSETISDVEELDQDSNTVTALYDFEDTSPGTLAISEGEKLTFISYAHHGWVVVRTLDDQEGYVPLAYVDNVPLVPQLEDTYVFRNTWLLICTVSQLSRPCLP